MDDNTRLTIKDILETVRKLRSLWLLIAGSHASPKIVDQLLPLLDELVELFSRLGLV